jgi:hypothetical protein
MSATKLLSPLEMEFIQSLHDAPEDDCDAEQTQQVRVEAAPQITDLLASCASKECLTIEAQIDNQRLLFTPHLVSDEQNTPRLELGVPQIFERGSSNRPWRLPLDPPRPLLSRNGKPGSLVIHELSMSELLVEQTANSPPPERFCLDIGLDEQPPLTLRGSLLRVTEKGWRAYELSLDDDDSVRLQSYLYRQHRNLYPLAHNIQSNSSSAL